MSPGTRVNSLPLLVTGGSPGRGQPCPERGSGARTGRRMMLFLPGDVPGHGFLLPRRRSACCRDVPLPETVRQLTDRPVTGLNLPASETGRNAAIISTVFIIYSPFSNNPLITIINHFLCSFSNNLSPLLFRSEKYQFRIFFRCTGAQRLPDTRCSGVIS